MTLSPASASAVMYSTFASVGMVTFSFCRPSRGPTSTTFTDSTGILISSHVEDRQSCLSGQAGLPVLHDRGLPVLHDRGLPVLHDRQDCLSSTTGRIACPPRQRIACPPRQRIACPPPHFNSI